MVQTALITGASSGIGKNIAKQLCERGYKVFACARRLEAMDDLKEVGAITIRLDVTSQNSVDDCCELVAKETDKLDLLFNNAGVPGAAPALDVPFEKVQHCFDVNVYGVIRMVQKFAKLVINAKGKIIQTGSLSSLVPMPLGSTYAVTKAAVLQYSNCLRVELAPFGVDVITLQLGRIDTGFSEEVYIAPDSLYKDATETLRKKKDFSRAGGSDNVETAVERILKSVLTTNPPANCYLGVAIWPGWLIGYVFPTGFGDYLTNYFWQFDKFAKRIRDKYS